MWMSGNFYDYAFATKALFAFVAGLVTFLAPCTLPLVPGYIGYLTGFSKEKSLLIKRGFLFVLGFSSVYIFFGTLAGALGFFLGSFRDTASFVGGLLVMFFGLISLGALSVPALSVNYRIIDIGNRATHSSMSAFVLGAALGFGWTPCIGPILGSVLTLAASSSTALEGTILLMFFCIGLGIPFIFIAGTLGYSQKFLNSHPYISLVGKWVGGILLIFMGLLLATNSFGYFTSWLFRAFSYIHYDSLLLYL